MEKQKVLSLIIVILIIIFSAFTVLLFALNLSSNNGLKIDSNNTFASEPKAMKPVEQSMPKDEVPLEVEIVSIEITDVAPENSKSSQQQQSMVAERPLQPGLQRTTQTVRQVAQGDNVSSITYQQWGNAYLWPDLYTYNTWRSENPDLIYPGETVEVPNRLGRSHQYNDEEIASMTASYLKVYELYKKQGAKANASKWYTLYSATRVMPNFLENNSHLIDPQDIEMAKKHMNEAAALR